MAFLSKQESADESPPHQHRPTALYGSLVFLHERSYCSNEYLQWLHVQDNACVHDSRSSNKFSSKLKRSIKRAVENKLALLIYVRTTSIHRAVCYSVYSCLVAAGKYCDFLSCYTFHRCISFCVSGRYAWHPSQTGSNMNRVEADDKGRPPKHPHGGPEQLHIFNSPYRCSRSR